MDELLLLIAEKGALSSQIRVSTKEIGQEMGMSQQNASIRLRSLESKGLINRQDSGVILSAKGKSELESLHSRLNSVLDIGAFTFHGVIVKGRGEGKTFISIPEYFEGIKKQLGFSPYHGTLNVEIPETEIEKRVLLRERRAIVMEGFQREGKSYGLLEFYRCKVNGLDGALIFPFRNHHGLRILEIISPYNLKETLGVSDGAEVKIEVLPK